LLEEEMVTIDKKLIKYFKGHEYPVEIIMLSIYMKGRYSFSCREIEEIGGVERDKYR
jgi:hypothetical protein